MSTLIDIKFVGGVDLCFLYLRIYIHVWYECQNPLIVDKWIMLSKHCVWVIWKLYLCWSDMSTSSRHCRDYISLMSIITTSIFQTSTQFYLFQDFNTYTYSCICTITIGRSSKNSIYGGMSIILVDWIGSGSTSSVVKYDIDCMFLWFSHNHRTQWLSDWTFIEGNDISILIYRTHFFLF